MTSKISNVLEGYVRKFSDALSRDRSSKQNDRIDSSKKRRRDDSLPNISSPTIPTALIEGWHQGCNRLNVPWQSELDGPRLCFNYWLSSSAAPITVKELQDFLMDQLLSESISRPLWFEDNSRVSHPVPPPCPPLPQPVPISSPTPTAPISQLIDGEKQTDMKKRIIIVTVTISADSLRRALPQCSFLSNHCSSLPLRHWVPRLQLQQPPRLGEFACLRHNLFWRKPAPIQNAMAYEMDIDKLFSQFSVSFDVNHPYWGGSLKLVPRSYTKKTRKKTNEMGDDCEDNTDDDEAIIITGTCEQQPTSTKGDYELRIPISCRGEGEPSSVVKKTKSKPKKKNHLKKFGILHQNNVVAAKESSITLKVSWPSRQLWGEDVLTLQQRIAPPLPPPPPPPIAPPRPPPRPPVPPPSTSSATLVNTTKEQDIIQRQQKNEVVEEKQKSAEVEEANSIVSKSSWVFVGMSAPNVSTKKRQSTELSLLSAIALPSSMTVQDTTNNFEEDSSELTEIPTTTSSSTTKITPSSPAAAIPSATLYQGHVLTENEFMDLIPTLELPLASRIRQRIPTSLHEEGDGFVSTANWGIRPDVDDHRDVAKNIPLENSDEFHGSQVAGNQNTHLKFCEDTEIEEGEVEEGEVEVEEDVNDGMEGVEVIGCPEKPSTDLNHDTTLKEWCGCVLVGIDCEMCYTEHGLELTRVTCTDHLGQTLFESLVLPDAPIKDYNFEFSGISEELLTQGPTLNLHEVQFELRRQGIIHGTKTVLVGHSIDSDMRAMKLIHHRIIDTSLLYPSPRGAPFKMSLKQLATDRLGMNIQGGNAGHDSLQDAQVAVSLTLLKLKLGPSFGVPETPQTVEAVPIWKTCPHPAPSSSSSTTASPPIFVSAYGGVSADPVWMKYIDGYRFENDVCHMAVSDSSPNITAHHGNIQNIVFDIQSKLSSSSSSSSSSSHLICIDAVIENSEIFDENDFHQDKKIKPIPSPPHPHKFTSLTQLDACLYRICRWLQEEEEKDEKKDDGPGRTSFVIATQPSLTRLHRMNEEKMRLKWEQRAYESGQCNVGTNCPRVWTPEDENSLSRETDSCSSGVAFFAEIK